MDKFTKLFTQVFDENYCFRACGREVCKELIEFMQVEYGVKVGDMRTGLIREPSKIITIYNSRRTGI